ncbi:alpha/beta hydrolase [Nevskia ramosa]|uniref:alpha/beta hydrolase n=1 Tax=Nevskia ramosa TaxID=64002 RepID=UPI00040741C0|nr:alpha/beta hydrolase [Nevskia ramosa]
MALGSVQTSNPITVAGINAASPISVVGGSYSVNGGAFVTTSGTVTVGQTVRVQQTASNTAGTTTVATLTIGGVSANYSVTTVGPVLSINDVSLVEGNSGTTNAVLTVSLSSASQTTVTVMYATADGTATMGSDYVATSGTLTFAPGVTTQPVTIGILGDTVFESDETVLVSLTNASGATIGRGAGVITITNDDVVQPTLSINDASLVEGNSGTTNAVLTVSLSSASQTTVTVMYATADGTATAGSDYVATSGTLTFAPGVTTQPVTIGILGDTVFESDETVLVNLTGASGAAISDGQGVITITNDDVMLPTLSVADASVIEGNSGSRNIVFLITLSPASATTTTVRAATSDGTATNGSDYSGGSVTISFAPGETSKSAPISVRGDTTIEPDETFFVTLSGASSGVAIGRGVATGTIIDDDGDRTPDAFSFGAVVDSATGSVETSNGVIVSGINTDTPITVSGGSYSVNGGAFTAAAGTVTVGQTVRVRQTASSSASTTTVATLTIGGVSAGFSVTTARAGDSVPDAFSFRALVDVDPSSTQNSDSIAITGIDVPSPVSVIGGLYSVNGGAYSGDPGTIRPGNTVSVQLLAPFTGSTTATATLNIGGVSADFRVTTKSVVADTTPDAFSFMPITNVEPGSEQTSNSVPITGITVETPISVTGGSYNVNGGPFGSAASVVRNGDIVSVKLVASSSFLTTTEAVLTIGGVSGNFSVTTKAFVADGSPDPFTFTNVYSVPRDTAYTSEPEQIRGINVPTPISITGGSSYSINGQPRTSAVGTVVNGDVVDIQLQSSQAFGLPASAVLTVGDYSATYSVETLAADTHPNAFAFAPAFNATPFFIQFSDEITVSGINTGTPISVNGGSYRIDGGPLTTDSGTVQPGARVQLSTLAVPGSESNVELTIGDVSASFRALTGSGIVSPSAFTFAASSGFPLLGTFSDTVTVSGITGAGRVEIVGGQYSINGGPFSSTTGLIRNGDTLKLLVTAGPMLNDQRTGTVSVGSYSTSWTVTTQAPVDVLVDLLRFPTTQGASVNSEVVSPPTTVNGINVPVPISINAPYMYSLNNGPYTGAAGTVVAGDVLRVKVVTGPDFGRSYSVDISIGQTVINWPVRTVGSATRPARFTLAIASTYPGALVVPGSVQFTQPVVVTNSTGPTAVTVTGGQYSINGGPYTSAAGTVAEGDRVVVRFVMPSTYSTSTSVNLRLGNTQSTQSISTTIDPVANTPANVGGSSANYVLRTDGIIPLRAFVFNPAGWQPSDRRSAYIDWSGGGWARSGLPGSRSRYWATEQGMVVIAPDQRVNDRFGTYAYVHADDARLVVRWAQENAAQLGIDPSRIVVTGTSSGGGNAVWASLLEPPVTTSFRNTPPFRVGAVVLRSGVSSTAPDAQLGQTQLDRFGPFADTISPELGIDSQIPPYLIFHADGDMVFAETANLRLCTSLRAMGRVCDFVNEAGLGHDWPETPGKTEESRAQELDFFLRIGILPSLR